MACLIKAPSEGSKGVVVFTTQERDHVIRIDSRLAERIAALKDRWLIGLHHNWHDYAFVYDPLYDFSMAGEDDLREASGRPFPLVPLDACNFVPPCFAPTRSEPFWDVLYIARAVQFKRLPEFLQCIRTLYDSGHDYRVLLISPIPPYKRSERATVFYELREVYESMFAPEERKRFTLLDPSFDYPFPFDLETLAHFYRSSRTFVHFADDERRCRVAAYAWASGVPVVGMAAVGSLLPAAARRPPAFYEVNAFGEFPDRIVEAITQRPDEASLSARRYVSDADTVPVLRSELERLLGAPLDTAELAADGLGIRLGRHHGIGGAGTNAVRMTVGALVTALTSEDGGLAQTMANSADPELELSRAPS